MSRVVNRSLPLLALLAVAPLLLPGLSTSAPAPLAGGKNLTNSIKMKLVRIAPGKFMMGSSPEERGHQPTAGPLHEVQITRPFYLGVYEVTQAQYKKVMGKNPSSYSSTGPNRLAMRGVNSDDCPVDSVSLDDAVKFCAKLSALPGEKGARRKYRLPTEAEWEYACRAGTRTPFHFGKTLSTRQANINNTLRRPTKVGSYKPNAWGLYDMHGNVWEWTADWYDAGYYAKSPKKDPLCTKGTSRMVRGGSWTGDAQSARSGFRGWTSGIGFYHIGLRVACTIGG
jgi:formylglycine-generating enzyme required for sulfatase activity